MVSFFYNVIGDIMKVYIDAVFLLNFIVDLLILITTSYILKRNIKSSRFILGGLIGSLTTFLLFFKINYIELFILKFLGCFLMTIATFSYRNIRYTLKNIIYIYIVSIILGGALYFFKDELKDTKLFSYLRKNNISFEYVFIIVFTPIILYLYSVQIRDFKNNYSNYYKVNIYLNNYVINVNAYLDTGNKLVDPYLKRPIIILNKKKMIYDINEFQMVLVPYKTISETNMLTCIIADKVEVLGLGCHKNTLIGIIDDNITIDGVDLILNTKLLEEINA